jgi:MraZ protein
MFFSGAVETVPDRQGRFIVPQYLKDFAGIKRDTMIVGVSSRIEIWDSELWKEFYANSKNGFEAIAEKILDVF